ncbi:MAG: Arm DNA-binding domain-containing protein [Steroidobacteraceae bacterium]
MGKERLLSVGVYPAISLSGARGKRDAIRTQVANGVDPSSDRQEKTVAQLGARPTPSTRSPDRPAASL